MVEKREWGESGQIGIRTCDGPDECVCETRTEWYILMKGRESRLRNGTGFKVVRLEADVIYI